MNKVVLIGRLTRDPELRFAPGTGKAVATVTLAVDRRFANKDGQRETDFIPVVIWEKQAESTANYMSKGRLMGVSGRIQTRSYKLRMALDVMLLKLLLTKFSSLNGATITEEITELTIIILNSVEAEILVPTHLIWI